MKSFRDMAPFSYDPRMQHINGSNAKIGGAMRVLDVRSWGYLTGGGHGALGLTTDQASDEQDQFGEMVAQMLNEKFAKSGALI